MRKSNDPTGTTRDSVRPEQDTTALSAFPQAVSAALVSGLYKLSFDRKLPFVPRAELLRGESAVPLPGAVLAAPEDQEYAEPELYDGYADVLLGSPQVREELRLDVDGQFPQMTASGTITRSLAGRINWIAKLRPRGRFGWVGHIWYKDGATQLFPYTNVSITVSRSVHSQQRRATAQFSGGGAPSRVRAFRYQSPYYRNVDFEFDFVEGVTPVTEIATDAHPNRPATLPAETLGIETVFRRAGFRTTRSPGGPVPVQGGDSLWSDQEMHDAMQAFWTKFANRPQWSLWTFFAPRHEMGANLGGIMFDDIGPNHRQGTAIFYDSFISQAPGGDAQPAAWIDRMRFWTAVHEMGHAFNLAHSWQKSMVAGSAGPWIPLDDVPEERSFMNYPFNVNGGQSAFFSDFEFRFSDAELLFLRHAPERFVQQGNADWFDDHGFQQALVSAEPPLALELRVNRAQPVFEFLEPVMLELKLTNVSEQPQLLPDDLISSSDKLTIVVKKQGQPARTFLPFAQYCRKPGQTVLRTGQSQYESLFVAAGRGGWLVSEPGNYEVQACLHLEKEDILSRPLALRIAPPAERKEEVLAQDFFSDAVGRTLAFDGTRESSKANNVLFEVAQLVPESAAAAHARIAFFVPQLAGTKRLDLSGEKPRIVRTVAQQGQARADLESLLAVSADRAAETLGHIDYNYYLNRFCNVLEADGELATCGKVLEQGRKVLEARHVIKDVIDALDRRLGKVAAGVPRVA